MKKTLIIVAVLIIVLLGGGFIAKQAGWIGESDNSVEVESAKSGLKTITEVVSASGKIQPEVEVIIRPDVSGEIVALPIKEGDYVKEGDLLLRIRPDLFQATIDNLTATLLSQKANKEQTAATVKQAELDFQQKKSLFDKSLIAELEYSASETNLEAQKANLRSAEYRIQSAQAQLRRAEEELRQTVIRAPMDGTISKLNVELGERVLGNTQMTGTELMRVARMNTMEVVVNVNENDIVNVNLGDTTRIDVDAYPERSFNGIVTEIANSAEIQGGGTNQQVTNYSVKVRILTPHNLEMAGGDVILASISENPEAEQAPAFKPGMSANVDIETKTALNVVAVPIQAVTTRDFNKKIISSFSSVNSDEADKELESAKEDTTEITNGLLPEEDFRKVLFVVRDGKAYRVQVETGVADETHIQITSGIDKNEEVVTGSYKTLSQELVHEDKVKINNNKRFKN
jgi:HlyD family secretion protein